MRLLPLLALVASGCVDVEGRDLFHAFTGHSYSETADGTSGSGDSLDAAVSDTEAACVRQCEGKGCGTDGCGGSCGQCDHDRSCFEGSCIQGTPSDQVFTEATIVGTIPSPTSSPRGLAYGDGALWVADNTKNIYKVDADDGSLIDSFLGPANAPIDIAYGSGQLYLAYTGDRAFRGNPNESSWVEATVSLSGLKGITHDGVRVITWEGSSLKGRNSLDLMLETTKAISDGKSMLAITRGNYVVFDSITTMAPFTATVVTLIASYNATAPLRTELSVALDASLVMGLAAFEDTLWIVTDGVGGQADTIVRLGLE